MPSPVSVERFDGQQPPPQDFWYETTVNEGRENEYVKIEIDYNRFLDFLHDQGFGLLISGDGDNKIAEVVHVRDNVVKRTLEQNNSNISVKQHVLDYLEERQKPDVRNVILRRQGTFFSLNFLTSLRPLELDFYRDTRHRLCFFFKNGFLEIRHQGELTLTRFQPYKTLKGVVWDGQIQDRCYHGLRSENPINIEFEQERRCEFRSFLELVSVETHQPDQRNIQTVSNYPAFRYALGYLLHSYKDVARAFAVLCVDSDPSEHSNGRRGKSLFTQAVELFRKMAYEDGKTLNTSSQFMFQTIRADDQVVLLDDVRKGFDFEQFYPTITGHCMVEYKNKGRFKIPFSDAPKFVFTSNRPILGEGDSDLARWFILPFVSYFSRAYTPFDEFKHRLFEDWDATEWANFFDYIADVSAEYLAFINCPLSVKPEPDLSIYNEEKLKLFLVSELLDYFDKYLSDGLPYEVPKKLFLEDFQQMYPAYEKRSQRWFTTRLQTYCKMRDIAINAGMPDGRLFKTNEQQGERIEYLRFTSLKTDDS